MGKKETGQKMSLNGKESSALIDDEESDISKEQMNEDERMEAFFCPVWISNSIHVLLVDSHYSVRNERRTTKNHWKGSSYSLFWLFTFFGSSFLLFASFLFIGKKWNEIWKVLSTKERTMSHICDRFSRLCTDFIHFILLTSSSGRDKDAP